MPVIAAARLGDLLQRMRLLSERTGKAARHCTNLLEAADLHGDLVNDMRHAATRILADLEHQIEFEGEPSCGNSVPANGSTCSCFIRKA